MFNNTWAASSEILGMGSLWWNITSSVKMRNSGLQLSFVFLPSSNFSVSVISFVTVDKEMFSEVILSFLCVFIVALWSFWFFSLQWTRMVVWKVFFKIFLKFTSEQHFTNCGCLTSLFLFVSIYFYLQTRSACI